MLDCVVAFDALELADWLAALEVGVVDEEPQAASTSAAASPAAATRARINGLGCTGQSVQSLTPGGAACRQRAVGSDSGFLLALCT